MRRSAKNTLSVSWQGAASRPSGRWVLRTSGLARIRVLHLCSRCDAPEKLFRVFALGRWLDSQARQKPKHPLRAFPDLSIGIVLVVVHNDLHGYSTANSSAILPATSGGTSISSFSDSQ